MNAQTDSTHTPSAGADAAAFAGHTPGPFRVIDSFNCSKGSYYKVCGPSYVVADINPVCGSFECQLATANLFAAAPSLLRERDALRAKLAASEASRAELVGALEGLYNMHDNACFICGEDDQPLLDETLSEARAALANARATMEGGSK